MNTKLIINKKINLSSYSGASSTEADSLLMGKKQKGKISKSRQYKKKFEDSKISVDKPRDG